MGRNYTAPRKINFCWASAGELENTLELILRSSVCSGYCWPAQEAGSLSTLSPLSLSPCLLHRPHTAYVPSLFHPIQKGLDYVNSHSSEEIAKTIQPQFKETDPQALAKIVERYKTQNTWKADTVFEKESFLLLENILEEGGELPARVPYEDLVTTEFSKKAAK